MSASLVARWMFSPIVGIAFGTLIGTGQILIGSLLLISWFFFLADLRKEKK